MPCFKLFTNLTKSDIPKDLVDKIIPVLARLLRKPAANFICMVSTDCQVTFGEQSTLPCAVASLESIGSIGAEDNKLVTKEVTEILEKELSIKPDRFFISFYDIKAYNIGMGGIIMSEIYG